MSVRLYLLAQPYAEVDGVRTELPLHKPAYLLLYLACCRDWVSREQLTGLFRPDAREATARHTVRLLLSRARKLPWAQGLEIEAQRLRWNVDSDLHNFRTALGRGDWAAAVARYEQPLLTGLPSLNLPAFDAWLELEREQLHTAWRHAALKQSFALSDVGEHTEAAALLRRLLHDDPLAEDVLQHYLTAAYKAGQRSNALTAYRTFAEGLEAELNLEPLEVTRQLVDTIRASAPLAVVSDAPEKPVVPLTVQHPPHLVGRTAEQTALQRSTARAVLVSGEPGIGKTRLLVEGFPHAHWLSCREGVQHVPYFPVVQAVRKLPNLSELGAYHQDLARLMPELGSDSGAASADGQIAKARILEALAVALETPGRALVFDDLQWADPSTLEVVALLAARGVVPVAGAYRSGEVTDHLERTLAGLRSSHWLENIPLKPLESATVQTLLANLIGLEDGPPRFSRWLFDKSGGNPFFALETLKALFEAGRLRTDVQGWHSDLDEVTHDYAEVEIPQVVTDVVRHRIRNLTGAGRRVLEAASVMRTDFTPQHLGPLTGLSEWATSDALAEAEQGELVRGTSFQHDLLRQAVYESLPAARRCFLHGKVAEVLATDAEPLVVAEHWFAAGDLARAAALWYDAVERFDSLGLEDEGIALCLRIVALEVDTPFRYRAMVSLADWYRVQNRWEEADALLDTVLSETRNHNARAGALAERAMLHHLRGNLGEAERYAELAAQEAAPTDDVVLHDNVLMLRSTTAAALGRYAAAAALVEPKVAALREHPPDFHLANWLTRLAVSYNALGRFDEALACHQEALAIARKLGMTYQQVFSLNNIAATYHYQGRVDEALSLIEEGLSLGMYAASNGLRYHLALACLKLGRVDEALEQAEHILAGRTSLALRARGLSARAHAFERKGDPTAAARDLDALLELTVATDDLQARGVALSTVLELGSAARRARAKALLVQLDTERLPAYVASNLTRVLHASENR